MTTRFCTILTLLMMLWLPADSQADLMAEQEPEQNGMSAHDRLMICSEQLKNFSALFEQNVIDESGRTVEYSSGTVRLLAPAYFRWDYVGDYPQQIVADGKQIWHYDIELEQITVKSQARTIEQSPLTVLMQPERLSELFDSQYLIDTPEMTHIRLLPVRSGGDLEYVDLGFEQTLLTSVAIRDGFGQETLIRFSEIDLEADVDLTRFQFIPPPGVDVLGIDDLDASQWSVDEDSL